MFATGSATCNLFTRYTCENAYNRLVRCCKRQIHPFFWPCSIVDLRHTVQYAYVPVCLRPCSLRAARSDANVAPSRRRTPSQSRLGPLKGVEMRESVLTLVVVSYKNYRREVKDQ